MAPADVFNLEPLLNSDSHTQLPLCKECSCAPSLFLFHPMQSFYVDTQVLNMQSCASDQAFADLSSVRGGSRKGKRFSWFPPAKSSTGQCVGHFAKISAARHWCWVPAHLYEQQSFIGVIAVTQACCEPVLQSSTGQCGMHFVDRKSTRLNSSHTEQSRMPSSA